MTTTATKERPILFSSAMVRAILAGSKTQTRRVVKPQPDDWYWPVSGLSGYGRWCAEVPGGRRETLVIRCPYGVAGDRLWVREAHYVERAGNADGSGRFILYRATDEDAPVSKWTPSIHMPRWASRLTLEITDVRVQRVADISKHDAIAEGIPCTAGEAFIAGLVGEDMPGHEWDNRTSEENFAWLWDSINGKRPGCAWSDNPWVWAVTFKRIAGGTDA